MQIGRDRLRNLGAHDLRWQLSWLDELDIQRLLMPVFGYAGNVSWEAAVKRHLCRCLGVDMNISDRELCLFLVSEELQYQGNMTWEALADFWKNSGNQLGDVVSPSFGWQEQNFFQICADVFQCRECLCSNSSSWTRQLQFLLAKRYSSSPDWRALFTVIQASATQAGDVHRSTSDFFSVVAMRLGGAF